jgi:hypothetical protein
MTVDAKEIQRLTAYAKELAIFVEHGGVAKTITEENAHDGRSKCYQGGL